MTTRSSKRCRRLLLLASLMAACAGPTPAPAQSLRLAAASEGNPGGLELFLEVFVNGVATGKVGRFVLRGDAWWASPATLRDLGLVCPACETAESDVPLAALAGLEVSYDAPQQRIRLAAPVALLDRPVERLAPSTVTAIAADAALPSLVFGYDAYAQRQEGSTEGSSLSAFTELRLSGVGPGLWSNTAVSRAASALGGVPAAHQSVRLDTSWLLDFPEAMASVSAGDAVTGALPWTRATRVGGVRLARNFGLQPYLSSAPPVLVQGEAVLPSTVDLYINGFRQVSRPVQPGRFTVEGTPMLNGVGQARLVITDLNGQQRIVDFPLYGTPQLLRAGLLDGSVELGAVRQDYGLRSSSYGRTMASATGRYGWTDDVTLEAHAEGDTRVTMAGGGGTWLLPGGAGSLHGAAAASQSGADAGGLGSLGYQWNRGLVNVALNTTRRSAGFRDVASAYGTKPPRSTDLAFAGASSPWGSFGVGYLRQVDEGAPSARLVNFSWTGNLPGATSLALAVVRDLRSHSSTASLSLFVPLDRRVTLTAGVQQDHGQARGTVGARQSTPGDLPGWGWRAEAGTGSSRGALAELSRLGSHGQWTTGAIRREEGNAPATTLLYGAANGSLLWVDGHAFAVPRVDEGFALVSTSGVPDVPVRVENRDVGRTDGGGLLLVRGLQPYERNRIAIDPLKLDADLQLEAVETQVVPPGRSGVAARFAMRHIVALQLQLLDAAGKPLPPGSPAWLEAPGVARRALFVGYDGVVYIEDPPPGARLLADAEGQPCEADLPPVAQERGLVDGGTVVCRPRT